MMLHCPNLNDTPSAGPLNDMDFESRVVQLHRATVIPAEAATDLGAEDETLPGDGEDRRTGFLICLAGAAATIAVALIGWALKS